MNRPDRASEPSMEDILASIRKIIAEEPTPAVQSARSSDPVVSPLPSNPLLRPPQPVPGQPPAPPRLRETLPLPSFDRITDVLRNPPSANLKPAPTLSNGGRAYASSAPRDDDLADLLQEPNEEEDREAGVAEPATSGAASPAGSDSSPKVKSAASDTAAAATKPPVDETWAIWRQTLAPPADASPPFGALGNRRSTVPRGAPAVPPISGVAAEPRKSTAAVNAVPAPEAKVPPFNPVVIAAMPATPPALPAATEPVTDVMRIAEERKAQEQVSVLLPPRQIAMEMAQPTLEDSQFASDTAALATSALELLATGSPPLQRSAPTFAASLAAARVAVTTQNQLDGVATPDTAPAVASGTGQPVRSLEDAVAEMLRPMLQQWLADHMPRIIDKALRIETAPSVKDGSQ